MKLLITLLFLSGCEIAIAQDNQSQNDDVRTSVETPAEPVGGYERLFKFIAKNIKYPASAQRNRIEGKSLISFVVEKDGTISNVKSIKPFNEDCDNEAIRVVKLMPKWKPGKQDGQEIRQSNTLPIWFRLAR